MYRTSTNVNQSQFTSQTTTTPIARPSERSQAHAYIDYNPTGTLGANDRRDLDDHGHQFKVFSNNHEALIQSDTAEQLTQQQHNNNNNNNNNCNTYDANRHSNTDSISLALDEIGAILNSKEFNEPSDTSRRHQQLPENRLLNEANDLYFNQDSSTTNTCGETKAAILANLKTIIGEECADEDSNSHSSSSFHNNMASTNNTGRQNKNAATNNLKSLFNNIHFDAPLAHEDKMDKSKRPYVEIVEQPAKCALRFRYKCEGRSAGSLPGVNSTTENKTFPSIRINNYVGRAVVVISCVTKDIPYRAHPHNIVGKEGCKKGICTIVINNEANMVRSFPSLGIQCVKRKDIEESLGLRESINVDPFRNGFAHKLCTSNIDLNVVRLCFQVFIQGSQANKCDVPLVPIVSDPIHDKKAMSDLIITKLSHCSAPATGGREVILLCDRISKDDIQIRFFEERDGKLIWETFTDLAPTDVHKQVAICFKTPKYYNENISSPVMVRVQLRRLSDNQVSEPRLFQFLPCESDEDVISRKRQKIEWVNMNHYELDNILQPPGQLLHHHHHNHHQSHHHQHPHLQPAVQQPHLQQQQHQHHHMQQRHPNNQSPVQQHSPVMSHQSQPPAQQVDQHFDPCAPLQHQLHHQPQQQQHQQLQSANSSPSHMNQPSASLLAQRQSINRNQHGQPTTGDGSNRGTPSPMHQQQQNVQRLQQNSPDHQQGLAHVQQQQQQHHLYPNNRQQQLRQSIDSPEMEVDRGNRTPTMMTAHQHQQQQTGDNSFVSAIDNLVVRREIIDNEGKVMRLVDRPNVAGENRLIAAASAGTSAAQTGTADKLQLPAGLHNRHQILASSLDRIDTAELMRDIAFSSNIDLNLDMGAENELN